MKAFQPSPVSAPFIPASSTPAPQQQQGPDDYQQFTPPLFNQPVPAPAEDFHYSSGQVFNPPAAQAYNPPPPQPFIQSTPMYSLNYHLYAPTFTPPIQLLPHQRRPADFFLPNDLRESLLKRNEAILQPYLGGGLPEYVHVYHSLVPLDKDVTTKTNPNSTIRYNGFTTWNYKAWSERNGFVYCLKRIEGYRLEKEKEKGFEVVKTWSKIGNSSASVVSLVEAFTTRVFGDASLVFVYEFEPDSKTLDEYMKQRLNQIQLGHSLVQGLGLDENEIWSLVVQIVSGLRQIHEAGLSARGSSLLLTGRGRVKLNGCGVLDILEYPTLPEQILTQQRQDFKDLARNMMYMMKPSLMVKSDSSPQGVTELLGQVEMIQQYDRHYSPELIDFIRYLLSEPDDTFSILQVQKVLGPHVFDTIDSSLNYASTLENNLSRELENGRLFRLICKLNTILDIPSTINKGKNVITENSPRYPLLLFRDYLFHQTDDTGKPVVDLGHILRALNKLDGGSEESVMLVGRDEQSCLVVRYKELKSLVEGAFRELLTSNGTSGTTGGNNGKRKI